MKQILGFLLSRLIHEGALTVTFADGSVRTFTGAHPGPHVGMRLTTRKTERGLVLQPALIFGEAYMDGTLIPEGCTLEELTRLIIANWSNYGGLWVETVSERLRYFGRVVRAVNNTLGRSRKNVAHHYDLDARLYEQFLDADRQYSCAYFLREDMSLEEAQEAKKHHLAAKLCLNRPDLEVLDIGCGWGGMALTLARDYGAKVLGITLSREQLEVARARAKAEGLEDRVRFEMLDYRCINYRFDRIVSVGMFEHVGVRNYGTFLKTIREMLADDGIAVLHSIGRMDGPSATNPWIDKYIFPGGYSPALSETLAAVERSGLWLADCEIWRLHYAKTLAHWRRRFEANKEKIRALYDDRFVRMFEFYLLVSELAFRYQQHMNFQLQLVRDQEAVPLTRDYITDSRPRQLTD